ncbi:hypothetical protein FEM33_15315 [Dyadobacter flavalbus]|uniref:Uncharacterized protein n=1 Tax=Dyadobacter flavalbus TaxID=2579942 RepID=A0A5M8QY01_9BACT|nr:hypothetical protein [Dyadobacter flavalbus]KAA6438882.1 hypothetical protein FEM33_15315 [Dyadobacter flavalbus]
MSIPIGQTVFNQKDLNSRVDLLSLAHTFLNEAEQLFGPIAGGYALVDCWYHDDGPEIFFPREPGQIAIRLSADSKGDPRQIVYQLAHEVVHCISPSGPGLHANVLEEGLAVYFSVITVNKYGLIITPKMESYKQALRILDPYLAIHPSFIKIVRQQEPYICKITKDQLLGLDIDMSEHDAISLSEKFVRF